MPQLERSCHATTKYPECLNKDPACHNEDTMKTQRSQKKKKKLTSGSCVTQVKAKSIQQPGRPSPSSPYISDLGSYSPSLLHQPHVCF